MARRKTRTSWKPARKAKRRTTRKVSRPWTREEVSFMRKYYRRFETAWCARQLGRTVYSIRYKAVDLHIKKANPSVWKGNKGPANAFRKSPTRKTTRRATVKRSTTKRSWRASTTRRTTRKPKARKTTRRRR